jgi:hypothetical protein
MQITKIVTPRHFHDSTDVLDHLDVDHGVTVRSTNYYQLLDLHAALAVTDRCFDYSRER